MTQDLHTTRLYAPATQRNRDPILEVLRRVLPATGTVLEIASGTGEHAVYFSRALPRLLWQPSEHDSAALESIAAWREAEGGANLLPPLLLDVASSPWPVPPVDAIFNANMIHIAPWEACLGLFAGAERHLLSGGVLILYGPYRVHGAHTAPSNTAFDRDLQARDSRWGVRNLEDVEEVARQHGIELEERVAMPANNQILVMRGR